MELNIFDFDGTIFRSPLPSEGLWDGHLYGLIRSDIKQNGIGWFQDPVTLAVPYVPEAPGEGYYSMEIVERIVESMENENAVTVMLTGRNVLYRDRVIALCDNMQLKFEHYGFKPLDDSLTTMNFKKSFIEALIAEYNPKTVQMWDDRFNHVKTFRNYLRGYKKIKSSVYHVDAIQSTLDPLLEEELVLKLIENRGFDIILNRNVRYSAVILNEESINIIRELSPPFRGWREYIHHCTLSLGSLPEVSKNQSFTKDDLGKHVEFNVIGTGFNGSTQAVLVNGVSTINKHAHITVAVSSNGKPRDSNQITEWEMLENPVLVSGIISEVFNITSPKRKRQNKNNTSQGGRGKNNRGGKNTRGRKG